MTRNDLITLFKGMVEETATTVVPQTGEILRGRIELNLDKLSGKPLRPASVLIGLVNRPEGMTLLLTKRRDDLAHHAGQISFPGGMAEPGDSSPEETALRETEEEIGLHRRHIEIVGRLDDYVTGSGFKIAPFIALIEPPFEITPCPREVAEVFEVPLSFLADPLNHKIVERKNSINRTTYAMPYGNHYIWGVTAGMIVSLSKLVRRS